MLQGICYKYLVTRYMLQVSCYTLHVTSYMLHIKSNILHVTLLQVIICNFATCNFLHVTRYKLFVTSYMSSIFFPCPSVQALAMVRFMSSSPSSYNFFIMFIRPALGSSGVESSFGSDFKPLESALILSA